MDNDIVIFWFIFFVCVSALFVVARRIRSAAWGWATVYLVILVTDLLGRFWAHGLIYAAGALWMLLVLIPGLAARFYYQRVLQERYGAAYKFARVIRWLHPADGWNQQPEIVRAVDLAQRGELTAAQATLERFQQVKSVTGLAAMVNLYRITSRWEEFRVWERQRRLDLDQHPQLLPALLRARGETGDLEGLAELYQRRQLQIARLVPPAMRDQCRLALFAFGGRRDLVERLFAGNLAVLPDTTRRFWLATADMAAGRLTDAKSEFELLLPAAEPPLRLAIQRRLSALATQPAPPGHGLQALIESVALEHSHDETFGARPSLWSRHAQATQTLIGLNLLMFGAEMYLGGGTNPDTLYRLGALFPPAVRGGEWWRLFAAMFLHFGPLHLAMNMFALWVLGPFVEFALGFARFLLVYAVSGIGSMAGVMALASGPNGQQLTVGASGCIMGLVGATGALMLRGWLREKALSARRRLLLILLILLTQSLFDSVIPQISMTAHLSGALIGFACALLLTDRLARRPN